MSSERSPLRGRAGLVVGILSSCSLGVFLGRLALIFVAHLKEFPLLASDTVRNSASQLKPVPWKAPYSVIALGVLIALMAATVAASLIAAGHRTAESRNS